MDLPARRGRPRLRLALTVGVPVLVVALAFAGQLAVQFYRYLHALRLDPMQLEVFARVSPPALEPGQRRVVLFGDSRSSMWSPPENAPSLQWVNRGLGQQTTAQALGRFDADVPKLKPDVIVLELGVNDLKSIPLFPEREREIVERAKQNLSALVSRARSASRDVILVTVFPTGPVPLWRRPLWSDRVQVGVDALNAHLATLVSPGVRLLAADPILLDSQKQLRPQYALDHLHLTAAGYRALNAKGLVPLLGNRGN